MAAPVISGYMPYRVSGAGATFEVNPNHGTIQGTPVATGDWIILILSAASSAATAKAPTPPGDWTEIIPFATVGSGTTSIGIWAKERLVGETTYTWSQNDASINQTFQRITWISGADDIAQWTLGSFVNREVNATTTTTLAPSISTSSADSLALCISLERTLAAESDAQILVSNFTKNFFNNTTDSSITISTKIIPTPGATGDVTTTYPNTHNYNGKAGLLGIPPAAPSPVGLPIKISDGVALIDARLQVSNGDGTLSTPGDLRLVPHGYASVAGMLAASPFYISHRGGSRDFPEMSLYSYGQSVLRGYGAIELSLARTSDGVWFGLHDATLDRTSGVTGVTASAITWAQVQSYEILGSTATNNPGQANRPYMRFEELMDLYYATHVIFIDPKVATPGFRQELLDMMDALPGVPTDRIVAKYYGVSGGISNTGWAFEASSRGYTTWGYFYQSDAANFATYQGRWDILGLDYNADQATWDDLIAYGKPVIGHVAPDSTAMTTAFTKGADGVVIAGIMGITPTTP